MWRRPIIFIVPRNLLVLAVLIGLMLIAGSFGWRAVWGAGIKDRVIVIDAGHGGKDPGAQYGGLKEKDINLDVALRLRTILEQKGSKVVLTRDSDQDFYAPGNVIGRMAKRIELNQRVKLASNNNADLFISIHTNSFPQRSSYGMETYYHLKSASGLALAERIQQELRSVQPENKRKAKPGDYYLINQTKMPAVIVEIGFLSNSKERKLLLNDTYKDSVAQSIALGIDNYFKDYPLGVHEGAPALSQLAGPPPATADTFRLYFPSNGWEELATEERQAPSAKWPALHAPAKIALILNELIKGPASPAHARAVPSQTQILAVEIKNGIATINLSHEIRDNFPGGALAEDMAVNSLVWSASQVPGIQGVRILIDGQFADSIGGHVILDHTFTPTPPVARAAIVIDDWGINNPGTQEILNTEVAFTAAVMPNMLYTRKEAELLHEEGHEIIMHMPLEAKGGRTDWLGPGALLSGLSAQELRSRLNQSFDTVPYAVGLSNHMGSKGSENTLITREIIKMAQDNNLFILDSKTSESSILAKEAEKAGLPWGVRDVFLDNSADLNSIKKQLRLLITTAKKNGKAIGIGHVGPQGPNTAQAIKELLPEFAKAGVQIVPLSELIQH